MFFHINLHKPHRRREIHVVNTDTVNDLTGTVNGHFSSPHIFGWGFHSGGTRGVIGRRIVRGYVAEFSNISREDFKYPQLGFKCMYFK